MNSLLKKLALRLQRSPIAPILSVAVSLRQSLRHRELQRVFIDKDGDWIHVQKHITVASPIPSLVQYDEIARGTADLWCHAVEIGPGDLVVDLGAGIGDDIVVFSRLVGPSGRVVAIEAHPRTFRCLQKTVALNGLENVTLLNMAASSSEGVVAISDGTNHISNFVSTSNEGIEVRAARLDTILADLNCAAPTLVKMNIEGAEVDALRGMPETLRTTEHVVVSCHDFLPTIDGSNVQTFERVKEILAEREYSLTYRKNDPRPWVQYFIYGSRKV